jgi:CheY-like chemotaxis protein
VFLDLRLPRLDGFSVLREIKSAPALRHVPVVILTSSSSDRDVEQAYAEHANSYLVKPHDYERLVTLPGSSARLLARPQSGPASMTLGRGAAGTRVPGLPAPFRQSVSLRMTLFGPMPGRRSTSRHLEVQSPQRVVRRSRPVCTLRARRSAAKRFGREASHA